MIYRINLKTTSCSVASSNDSNNEKKKIRINFFENFFKIVLI